MPDFQSFNYAALQPQDNTRNLLEALQQGLQTGYMPFQMRRQAESEDLANAFKRMQMQNEPENERLQQDLLRGQIQQIQNPRPTEFEQKMKLLQQYLSGQNPLQNDVNEQPQNPLLNDLNKQTQNPNIDDKQTKYIQDAFIKNLLGLPAESPEEKYEREMKEYEAKKNIDQKYQKPSDDLTVGAKTQFQEQVKNIDLFLPMLQRISEIPIPKDPNEYSTYKSNIALATEKLMASNKLPRILEAMNMSKDVVKRGFFETAEHYQERIGNLIEDMWEQRDILEGKKIPKRPEKKTENDQITKLEGAPKGFQKFQVGKNKRVFTIPDANVPNFLEKAKGL
jgi:hypothetical protein